jgi:hypothetical protein
MKTNEQKALNMLKAFAFTLLIALLTALIAYFVPITSLVSILLGIASLILMIIAFRVFSKTDERFRVPYIFSIVALAGTIIITVGLSFIMGTSLYALGATGFSSVILITGGVIIGLIILTIGAIIGIIGSIFGMILGLWRLGKKYKTNVISLGAILIIFPVLNIVGVLMVIIGLFRL